MFRSFILLCLLLVSKGICQHNGYINSNSTFLYYNIIGKGKDTVVIPLNYWNTDTFEKYSDRFTFIFYDTRDRRNSKSIEDTSELGEEIC